MQQIVFFLIIACFGGAPVFAQTQKAWVFQKEYQGIRVYSQSIPGSSLLGFRGTKTVDLPLIRLAELIMDPSEERKKLWIDMIRDFRYLQMRSDGFRFYSSYNLPWPAMDRDFIANAIMQWNPEKGILSFQLQSYEPNPAIDTVGVRGQLIGSLYQLEAISPSRTLITAEIKADPGGILPPFLVNFIQSDWPVNTLQAMEREAMDPTLPINPALRALLLKP